MVARPADATRSVAQRERRRPAVVLRRDRHVDGDAVVTPRTALARELARARRYVHPLTLIGIRLSSPADAVSAADAVRRNVRTVDVVWAERSHVFILLPESTRADGSAQLARLRTLTGQPIPRAAGSIAVFPDDALTAVALLEVARERMPAALATPPTQLRHATLEVAASGRRPVPGASS